MSENYLDNRFAHSKIRNRMNLRLLWQIYDIKLFIVPGNYHFEGSPHKVQVNVY